MDGRQSRGACADEKSHPAWKRGSIGRQAKALATGTVLHIA